MENISTIMFPREHSMEYECTIDVNELEFWAKTHTPGTLPLVSPSSGVAPLSLLLVALVCSSTRLCPDVFLSFSVSPSSHAILHPVLLTLAPNALRRFRDILSTATWRAAAISLTWAAVMHLHRYPYPPFSQFLRPEFLQVSF